MIPRATLRTLAAAAGGTVVALALPALAAVSTTSPPIESTLAVDDGGKISSRGAAVTVPVSVDCPRDGYFARVTVEVSQRSGNGVASGSAEHTFECTGSVQQLPLYMQASDKVFRTGEASVRASLLFFSHRYGVRRLDVAGPVTFSK